MADNVKTRHALSLRDDGDDKTIGQKRFQNPGKKSLSSIVGSYKSVVTKNARKINSVFGWQTRFHDHVIRNERAFSNIESYIFQNPLKWQEDKFNNSK